PAARVGPTWGRPPARSHVPGYWCAEAALEVAPELRTIRPAAPPLLTRIFAELVPLAVLRSELLMSKTSPEPGALISTTVAATLETAGEVAPENCALAPVPMSVEPLFIVSAIVTSPAPVFPLFPMW